MHFVVFLCTFFLFFSCFSLYLSLNLFASIPAFLFYLLIFFQIFHSRLCCSIKVNRKDQVDIAFSIIFDEARCFRIHQINCYFFVVDNTKCIDQEFRIESDQQIWDLIFNSISSSLILMMIGFLSPSFTRSVARSIQLSSSFLLILTFVS